MKQKIKEYFKFDVLSLIVLIVGLVLFVVLFLIYLFVLNKLWFDALSVIGAIYIGSSLLFIIFKLGEFHHFKKVKDLFVIKKENKYELTKLEQKQMAVLNLNFKQKNKGKKENKTIISVFLLFIFLGLIFLIISIPFFFI